MSFPKLGVKPRRCVVTEANMQHPFEENTALLGTTPTHVTCNSTDEPPSASRAKALLWEGFSVDDGETQRPHCQGSTLASQVAAGMLLRGPITAPPPDTKAAPQLGPRH